MSDAGYLWNSNRRRHRCVLVRAGRRQSCTLQALVHCGQNSRLQAPQRTQNVIHLGGLPPGTGARTQWRRHWLVYWHSIAGIFTKYGGVRKTEMHSAQGPSQRSLLGRFLSSSLGGWGVLWWGSPCRQTKSPKQRPGGERHRRSMETWQSFKRAGPWSLCRAVMRAVDTQVRWPHGRHVGDLRGWHVICEDCEEECEAVGPSSRELRATQGKCTKETWNPSSKQRANCFSQCSPLLLGKNQHFIIHTVGMSM